AQAGAASVAESQTTTGVSFVLPHLSSISGVVTDDQGAPVGSAVLVATSSGGVSTQATTNAAGAYELDNLTPGTWTVTPQTLARYTVPAAQTATVSAN